MTPKLSQDKPLIMKRGLFPTTVYETGFIPDDGTLRYHAPYLPLHYTIQYDQTRHDGQVRHYKPTALISPPPLNIKKGLEIENPSGILSISSKSSLSLGLTKNFLSQ